MTLRAIALLGLTAALAWPASPAFADGPATPQAVAANAEFLATVPAPPGGAGGVCVIDSGVDTTTDLGPALAGRNSVDGGTPDDLGARSDTGDTLPKHGTYVAGVIASQIDGIGSSGIWPAARIYSSRAFAGSGGGTTAQRYINAMTWCATSSFGVKVINLSVAGLSMTAEERQYLHDKIVEMRDVRGINVVAAVGNSGLPSIAFPAAYPETFSVGATDAGGRLAGFSNRGNDLDIATLGTELCVTTPTSAHVGMADGTSFSAPVVSAVLAALRTLRPDLTPTAAEDLLRSTARLNDGWRALDAQAAFRAAGLDALVDGGSSTAPARCEAVVQRPASGTSGGASSGAPSDDDQPTPASPPTPTSRTSEPAVAPPVVSVALPRTSAHAARRPAPPTLRGVTFRRGTLTIRVAGRRPRDRVVFMVDKHRFVRRTSTLRLRTRRWNVVLVRIVRPGVPPSRLLTITRRREF